jgi:deoxyribose-phosphate aldolase
LVRVAKEAVGESGVKVASVATAFPSGQSRMKERLSEIRYAVGAGADEIDMVISRGKLLHGEFRGIFDEVVRCKEACGEAQLKVILEPGELQTYDTVRVASEIAMAAGADFIKTSTGKVQPAATLPVTLVMLEAIQDFHDRTGRMVGMKPAGGIGNAKLALQYLVMVKETLGKAWLTKEMFRFGASSLTNDLLMQIRKQQTGRYQSADYFSKD